MNVHNCLTTITAADAELETLLTRISNHYFSEQDEKTDEDDIRLNEAEQLVVMARYHLKHAGLQLAKIQQDDHVEPNHADHV